MTKYKVYLRSGTVLEVEAAAVVGNEKFVHFYEKVEGGAKPTGSFSIPEIFGFCKSDQIKQANELVVGINPAK
jgi:hypothetical protein